MRCPPFTQQWAAVPVFFDGEFAAVGYLALLPGASFCFIGRAALLEPRLESRRRIRPSRSCSAS